MGKSESNAQSTTSAGSKESPQKKKQKIASDDSDASSNSFEGMMPKPFFGEEVVDEEGVGEKRHKKGKPNEKPVRFVIMHFLLGKCAFGGGGHGRTGARHVGCRPHARPARLGDISGTEPIGTP